MSENILLFTLLGAFILSVALLPLLIPALKRLKFGQSIREEGPQGHAHKSGTPTMGGIVIIITALAIPVFFLLKFGKINTDVVLLLVATLGFGLIGFLDDFIKVVLKRNLGLKSLQKLIGQILVTLLFFLLFVQFGYETTVAIPITDLVISSGWFFLLFILFYFAGTTNAVNLTDGLDGLCSGTSVIAFGAFTVIAWSQGNVEVAIFCMAIIGSLLAFLVFNAYPAKIFMGDTGSLALGGAIAAVALVLEVPFLLIIIGGVYMMETLSVIIQVISFKTTGKRVFKMSPIHHHFELCGWSEWKVVTVFWSVGLVLAVIGVYIGVFL